MDLMERLDKKEIREFFSKGWMTHDAMWFYHCLQELGAEQANRINKAAVKSMTAVEIHRIKKLMGRDNGPVQTFEELREIIDSIYKLIQPEFMKLNYEFPEKNVFRGSFQKCFAYEGLNKFGMIDIYQCGIVPRVQGWFDGLGVPYEMVPEFNGCLMNDTGKCEIEFHFSLK